MDNPSAFPREDYQSDDAPGHRGMTLRDYFAGQALVGFVATAIGRDGSVKYTDELAEATFLIADAMLRARAEPDDIARRLEI